MFLQLQDMIRDSSLVVIIILGVLALLQCVAGYKLYRIWGMIVGFLFGFILAYMIANQFHLSPDFLPALIAAVVGVIVAGIAFSVHNISMLIYGGALVDIMLLLVCPFPQAMAWQIISIVVACMAFLLIGAIFVRYKRNVIMPVTAIAGAVCAVTLFLYKYEVVDAPAWTIPAVTAGIALAGCLIQFLTTKSDRQREKDRLEEKRRRRETRMERRRENHGKSVSFSNDGKPVSPQDESTGSVDTPAVINTEPPMERSMEVEVVDERNLPDQAVSDRSIPEVDESVIVELSNEEKEEDAVLTLGDHHEE